MQREAVGKVSLKDHYLAFPISTYARERDPVSGLMHAEINRHRA